MSNEIINIKSAITEVELKILSDVSEMVQKAIPRHESLEEVVKAIGQVVDYRSASVFSIIKDTGQLEEVATIGRRVDLINFVSFDMGNGISAWVAKQKRPILLNNVRKSKGGTHTRSFLSVPVMLGDDVSGVINLAHDEAEAFSQRDADIIKIFSNFIALILERINHVESSGKLQATVMALSEELEQTKQNMQRMEKSRGDSELVAVLSQKINNPLAIIAGNAQFLLMTMKNSSGSVLKRLKAIDHEASNIISITEQIFSLRSNVPPKTPSALRNDLVQINKN